MEKTISFFDKNGVKKGSWSEEEDDKLRAYIQRYGHWNWGLLPKFAGLSRSGKSCRLRWMNYLRPDITHGNFTKEEDDIILDLQNKWSAMAAKLPGRSDNEIKNRWNTQLKKRAQEDKTILENENDGSNDQANMKENPDVELQEGGVSSESPSYSSCSLSGLDFAVSSDFAPQTSAYESAGDFWSEPFLLDTMLSPSNFMGEYISGSSCQDDEFSWSTLDPYFHYTSDFVNWSF